MFRVHPSPRRVSADSRWPLAGLLALLLAATASPVLAQRRPGGGDGGYSPTRPSTTGRPSNSGLQSMRRPQPRSSQGNFGGSGQQGSAGNRGGNYQGNRGGIRYPSGYRSGYNSGYRSNRYSYGNPGYRSGFGYGRPGFQSGGVTIIPRYQTNIYAPLGYGYDPSLGFVPLGLGGFGYGYGGYRGYAYGYQTDGITATFGGSGVGGPGIGASILGGTTLGGITGFGGQVPTYVPPPLAPPTPGVFAPQTFGRQSVLVDTRIESAPPLPPVEAELFNSSNRDIEVTLTDLSSPDESRRFRIPAGGTVVTTIRRDAGGEKIRVYESYDALGNPTTREVSDVIRPEILYEVVVHQWAMQSVAIDRTGKSPDVIEDVNFQGRGIGRFSLPPGDRFRGGRIDVFGAAKAADNAGTIAPITAEAENRPTDNASKLERAVIDAQREAMQ